MRFSFDGQPVEAQSGQTIGAALWAYGLRSWRTTRTGAGRGLYCGIGVCFDCLVTVDGVPNQRACLVPAAAGRRVTTGPGEHAESPAPVPEARHDLAVVGAGPAGLAAAATAAEAGLDVVVLDTAARPGGQFWRHRPGTGDAGQTRWREYTRLRSTVDKLATVRTSSPVWFVEPGFTLHTPAGPVRADRLVIATGAYDRSLPFPGWELPGVVTPGCAQALLKGSGVLVGTRVVVAGAGPFLLPVAAGLAAAGATVVGVYEAGNPMRYLRDPVILRKLPEAARYAARLARYRVPYHPRHRVVAARGADRVSAVDVVGPGGRTTVACDALAIGYGFTPQVELPLALGCDTAVGSSGSLVVRVDPAGRTSVPGVWAAGEVTGVGGAELAVVAGRLVGAAVAVECGLRSPLPEVRLGALLARRTSLRRFAEVMHATHAPPLDTVDGEALLCRCEEVTLSDARQSIVELGARDARTVKMLARPGMGWCQGRVCGFATAVLTARTCGREVTADDLAALFRRPLAQPVPLGQLADGGT